MQVRDLIKNLQYMPQDAVVRYISDGGPRGHADYVYLANSGAVILAGQSEMVSATDDRPVGSPTSKEDPYWHTGKIKP
jgi:hypothetical protein